MFDFDSWLLLREKIEDEENPELDDDSGDDDGEALDRLIGGRSASEDEDEEKEIKRKAQEREMKLSEKALQARAIKKVINYVKDELGLYTYEIENGEKKKVYGTPDISEDKLYLDLIRICASRGKRPGKTRVDAYDLANISISALLTWPSGALQSGKGDNTEASPTYKKIQSMRIEEVVNPDGKVEKVVPVKEWSEVYGFILEQVKNWAGYLANEESLFGKSWQDRNKENIAAIQAFSVDAEGKQADYERKGARIISQKDLIGAPEPEITLTSATRGTLAYQIKQYLKTANKEELDKALDMLADSIMSKDSPQFGNLETYNKLLSYLSQKGESIFDIKDDQVSIKNQHKDIINNYIDEINKTRHDVSDPTVGKLTARFIGIAGFKELVSAIQKTLRVGKIKSGKPKENMLKWFKVVSDNVERSPFVIPNFDKWKKLVNDINQDKVEKSNASLSLKNLLAAHEEYLRSYVLDKKSIMTSQFESPSIKSVIDKIDDLIKKQTAESKIKKYKFLKNIAPLVLNIENPLTPSQALEKYPDELNNIPTAANYIKEIKNIAKEVGVSLGATVPEEDKVGEVTGNLIDDEITNQLNQAETKLKEAKDANESQEEIAKKQKEFYKWRNIGILGRKIYNRKTESYGYAQMQADLNKVAEKAKYAKIKDSFVITHGDTADYISAVRDIVKNLVKNIMGKDFSLDDWNERNIPEELKGYKIPPSPYEKAVNLKASELGKSPEEFSPEERASLAGLKKMKRWSPRGKRLPGDFERERLGLMTWQKDKKLRDEEIRPELEKTVLEKINQIWLIDKNAMTEELEPRFSMPSQISGNSRSPGEQAHTSELTLAKDKLQNLESNLRRLQGDKDILIQKLTPEYEKARIDKIDKQLAALKAKIDASKNRIESFKSQIENLKTSKEKADKEQIKTILKQIETSEKETRELEYEYYSVESEKKNKPSQQKADDMSYPIINLQKQIVAAREKVEELEKVQQDSSLSGILRRTQASDHEAITPHLKKYEDKFQRREFGTRKVIYDQNYIPYAGNEWFIRNEMVPIGRLKELREILNDIYGNVDILKIQKRLDAFEDKFPLEEKPAREAIPVGLRTNASGMHEPGLPAGTGYITGLKASQIGKDEKGDYVTGLAGMKPGEKYYPPKPASGEDLDVVLKKLGILHLPKEKTPEKEKPTFDDIDREGMHKAWLDRYITDYNKKFLYDLTDRSRTYPPRDIPAKPRFGLGTIDPHGKEDVWFDFPVRKPKLPMAKEMPMKLPIVPKPPEKKKKVVPPFELHPTYSSYPPERGDVEEIPGGREDMAKRAVKQTPTTTPIISPEEKKPAEKKPAKKGRPKKNEWSSLYEHLIYLFN